MWPVQNQDKDEWMLTYTGKKIYPLRVRSEDICLLDIAHSLAQKCRFTGHTRAFYSVAQHSVLVSRHTYPRRLAAWGLLHDAAEAYLPDVCSNIKHRFPLIVKAEKRILKAVAERFGLPRLSKADVVEIKRADVLACYWEGRRLMPLGHNAQWDGPGPERVIQIVPWPAVEAERRFLRRAKALLGGE